MKISYELAKEDYLEFNLHHMSKSRSIKRGLFIERYIISIMFLLVPFMLRGRNTLPVPVFYGIFIVMFGIWVAFFPKYFWYNIKKRLEKMLSDEKYKGVFGPQNLSITDFGIFEFENSEKSKVTMKDVEKVDVTDKGIYIYISAANAYVIPMRAFKSLSEKHELIDLLKKHCKVCEE